MKKQIEKRSSDTNIVIHKKSSLEEKPMDEPLTQDDLIDEKDKSKKEGAATAASFLSRQENTLGKIKVDGLTPSPVPVKSENEE